MKGTIFDIMRYSVNDGPGIRTTVFFKGCPLGCAWCHNPESVSSSKEIFLRADRCIRCGGCLNLCPHHAIEQIDGAYVTIRERCLGCGKCIEACCSEARERVGTDISVEELIEEVEKDRVFYDQSGGGVTFSGGEPLLQHEFLLAVLEGCKRRHLHSAVDTSGYAPPDVLERIAAVTDLFLYDLKSIDDARHREFTGVSNELILENLRRLMKWGNNVIVRIPVIPGINDHEENVCRVGAFIASLERIQEVHLLPYHTSGAAKYERVGKAYTLGTLKKLDSEQLKALASQLTTYLPRVIIGG